MTDQQEPPPWTDEVERDSKPSAADDVPEAFPFVWANHIAADEDGADEILEDILTRGAMSVWYGESNSGKTYLVLDLARAIAKGQEWLGKRTVQGCVIYVAAEGSKTIERRIRAIRMNAGELEEFPLGVVKTSVNLLSPDGDTNALAKLINAKAAEMGMPCILVIIDTLSRALAGGNENDSKDMGALVKNGDWLRELTQAHVAWVHHTGKELARGARGHSLLRAATDTEIEISWDSTTGVRTAKVTKQRDLGSNGLELYAKLVPHELGINQWGKPITACTVEQLDASNAPKKATKKLNEPCERALKIAREVAKTSGLTAETSVVPGGKRLIDYEEWREKFLASCGPIEPPIFRTLWNRVRVTLNEAGVTGNHEKMVWLW